MKLEVRDTYKEDEKLTTNFEPTDNTDVINKAYLDEKLFKRNGHFSTLVKDYYEIKLQYNKILYRRGLSSKSCEDDGSSTL